LNNQRETLRLTQLRRDAGVGEEQDVASAAARVAAIEASIPSIEYEVSRAEYHVAVLTGTRPGELNADLSPRTYPAIAKVLRSATRANCSSAGPMSEQPNAGLLRQRNAKALLPRACFRKLAFPDLLVFLPAEAALFLPGTREPIPFLQAYRGRRLIWAEPAPSSRVKRRDGRSASRV